MNKIIPHNNDCVPHSRKSCSQPFVFFFDKFNNLINHDIIQLPKETKFKGKQEMIMILKVTNMFQSIVISHMSQWDRETVQFKKQKRGIMIY